MDKVLSSAYKIGEVVSASRSQSSWWLSGGIDSGIAVAAYKFVDRSDMATALLNLVNPSTGILTEQEQDAQDHIRWSTTRGLYSLSNTEGNTTALAVGSRVDTNIQPTSSNWSIFIKFKYTGATNSNVVVVGAANATSTLALYSNRNLAINRFSNYGTLTTSGADSPFVNTVGTFAVTPGHGYRNGVEYSTGFAQSGSGGIAQNISLFCLNNNGTLANPGLAEIYYMAIYSGSLTLSQVTALHNAVQ